MSTTEPKRTGGGRLRLALLVPLGLFLALAAIFLMRLVSGGDPESIPSALIGHPAPDFDLPPLQDLVANGAAMPGLKRADLLGRVTIVNIFASWCGPCRLEHPLLAEIAGDKRIRLVGINYKDEAENARSFLGEFGNPYAAVGVDEKGRASIDWGVYGVPETFIVGTDGTILYKFIGPLVEDSFKAIFLPQVEKAAARG
jgi:cytochrome c biogenesis protein CcmG/thiol:disulfide interchange protein DsbE